MPQRLRIFVSSPGDVPDERLRADLIIDKLAQDYSRFFTIESYRWEHEPMLASAHFQDAIEPPSKFDIVVLILWSRLGTNLPEKTALREYRGIDDRAPVTGTEWEYEDALRAAREHGAPDLLAFRNVSSAPVDPRDPNARARSIEQLDALDAFWKRHFADRGVFLAAYDEYRTLDEFARRLEEALSKLIERHSRTLLAEGGSRSEAVWLHEPFRGLEPYEFEHAAIFFGRDALATKATEQLAVNARAGVAFLLVSGASGSGKSSLVKAAVVPRLMKPQRISGAAFLRRAVFRPGTGGADLILALAETLTRGDGTDGVGLPELLAPGQDAGKLAAFLRGTASEPGYVFESALGRLTEAARKEGLLLAYEQAKLILVVDQLEEIFTIASITPEQRQAFVTLLGGMARSGCIWVVATLRADFWHRAAEMPELIALTAGLGRLDVAAPLPRELAEMIRRPAEAAGLSFEEHKDTGVRLDAVLAEHAAAEPGVLPLLSFALDELYKDMRARDSTRLTYASYEALGELEGAIAKRADDIVASLPADAQAALPRVLRALTTVSDAKDLVPVARPAPLANFAPGSPARMLVDAFTAARLLVAASEGGGAPTVRLAHEALIGRWHRAREQLISDRRDLAIRSLVEQQLRRYSEARPGTRRGLLLRHPDLANASDLARRWGDELDAATLDFIRRSERRARVTQTLTAAAAVLFAVLAVGASIAARRAVLAEGEARTAQAQAESQRQLADQRANEALIGQSRSLGALVYNRMQASDPAGALALALEALPTNIAKPERPYTPEAELTLRVAYRFALTNDLEQVWQTTVPDPVNAAALSPDAQAVALASDTIVRVIDRTGASFTLPDPTDHVWALRFLPHPNQLLVASKSTLRVFDVAQKKDLMRVDADAEHHICGWHFLPNRPVKRPVEVYTAEGAKTPERVKLAINGPAGDFAVESGPCVDASSPFSPLFRSWETVFVGGRILMSAMLTGNNNTVRVTVDEAARLWVQTQGNARQAPTSAHDKFVEGFPTSDGMQVVAALDDGRIAILDTTSLVRLKETPATGRTLANIDLSANNQQILIGYRDKTAEIWARRSFKEMASLGGAAALADTNLSTCDAAASERHADSRDGTLRVKIADGAANLVRITAEGAETAVADLGEPHARVRDAVFSPDGRHLIVAAEPEETAADKILLVYDSDSGKLLDRKQHELGVGAQCVRVSPDERHLAIVDATGVRIADAAAGTLVREFKFPTNRTYRALGIAFNPAGDRIAALDSDGTFYMVDAAAGRFVDQANWQFLAGTAPVPIAFDPSGNRVLFVSDHEAYAWSFVASVQEMLDTARAYVPSCISPALRSDFYLADEPPAWCIDLGKPPYDSDAWKQWLADKRAGKSPPMPGVAATKVN